MNNRIRNNAMRLSGAVTFVLAAGALLLGPGSARAQAAKPTVVLVHGAFADGSSWQKVIPLLQKRGLKVVSVQNPLTSLADDVAATRRAINAATGPVVLVGHSWGGTVITEAGANDKVQGLVYVSAFAPSEGQTTAELGKGYPPSPGIAKVVTDAEGFQSLPAPAMSADFAQDLPAAQAALMTATQGPIRGAAFGEKVSAAAWKSKPSWYIVTARDRMIDPGQQAAMAKKIGATTTTLQASHVSMLSKPREVATVIATAAGLPPAR